METRILKDEDVEALLNDLVEIHGYDFTGYTRASLKRRISRLIVVDKLRNFQQLRHKISSDNNYLTRFIEEITVNVTEMFRDPEYYKFLRLNIIPLLSSYPLIRIWLAGCATGEEVYSMAILLKELNLFHKSLLYATDINPAALSKAMDGMFPLTSMKQYSENYIQSGGIKDFSSYYSANYNHAKFDETLRSRVIFSTHNLVSDGSFNEFQLILCRNVLIYFDKALQEKVFTLFDQSLEKLGFLGLGSKETLRFSGMSLKYRQTEKEKIWRKIA